MFDHSRMILISQPPPEGDQARDGVEQKARVVLTSESVMQERPELEPYRTEAKAGYGVWAGNDPSPVYLKFNDDAELERIIGSPSPQGEDTSGYGMGGFGSGPYGGKQPCDPNPSLADELTTAAQIIEAASPIPSSSAGQLTNRIRAADWTGIEARLTASPAAVDEVRARIEELDRLVESCGLSNFEQQRVKALTGAILKLIESPQPEWKIVIDILNSPALTALLRVKEFGVLFFAAVKLILM